MQVLLVFIVVFVLSVLASSRWLLQWGRFFFLAQLSASGLLFLVFGALVGPHALGLLDVSALDSARPLLSLALGVCGLLVGINLEPHILRRLPLRAFVASAVQSGAAFVAVCLPMAVMLWLNTPPDLAGVGGAAVMLGAAASVSSAHFAVLWYRSGRMEHLRGLSVALVAMLDDMFGLAVLALALVFASAISPALGLGLVALAILLGLTCGALIAYLIHGVEDGAELTAILLGGAALVAGAAAFLRVSGLLAGVMCGATLALVGGTHAARAFRALGKVERPTYLLLLFLIGAHLDATDWKAWAVLPVFVALRFLGKVVGGRMASTAARGVLRFPRELGYALVAQGGLSLCMAIEYLLLVPRAESQLVFGVVVIGALVNEVLGARTIGLSTARATRPPARPVRPREAA
ncbi:MAG: cation:proton antiporter [Myxococcota bacterium]|nr:cation:proton antiporter [Myxococcota bacterium]